MKKFINFLLLCFSVVGAIGGFGYSIFCGAYPVAVGVVVLTYSAWPMLKKYFTTLTL